MRLRDLGPMVVETAGSPHELGRSKQAALLSLLAARVNERVPAEDLVTVVWGLDAEVSSARLDSQVWRLRNLLEPARGRSSAVLVRDGGGYRLSLAADQVDSAQFEALAGRAARELSAGPRPAALDTIDQALALWRGEPFQAAVDDSPTLALASRWQELRDQLAESRIDVLLELGAADRALVDLAALIVRNPLRERLWWQRMTALARLRRAEEALTAYRQVTSLLAEELGLDPGPELRQLQARILARDPSLLTPPSSVGPAPGPVVGPAFGADPVPPVARLPRRGARLIGRDVDLARVTTLVRGQPLVTITGTGGCGKTRLAVEVAAAAAATFPDGVFFVDLTTATTSPRVIDVVVTSLRLAPSPVADPLRALSEFTHDRRMLLVLDNCEHVLDGVAEVVDQLLADTGHDPGAGPAVLATSREPIGLEGEHVWSISPLSLRPVHDPAAGATTADRSPAVQLFMERAAAASPTLELDEAASVLAAEICRALDGLPLAIELAAARVRSCGLSEIVDQARADPSRLARIGRFPDGHRQSLYDAIEWSYRLLTTAEQRLHRHLSVLPGPFTLSAARGVAAGAQLDEFEVADALLGLAHRSLLDVRDVQTSRSPTTYAQLDTVRAHAHRQLTAAGEAGPALDRRDRWVGSLLTRRPRLGHADTPAWFDELDVSYPVVRAALQRAVEPGGDAGLVGLGVHLGFFWYLRPRVLEAGRWLEAAQSVDHRPAGGVEDTVTRLELAAALLLQFRVDAARPHVEVALSRLASVPSGSRPTVAEALVSAAGGAWACVAVDLLTQLTDALSALAAYVDDDLLQLFADIFSCVATLPGGHFAAALPRANELYRRSTEADNLLCSWFSALVGCAAAAECRRPREALEWARRALQMHDRLGSGGSRAFLEAVGNSLALTQDYRRAVRLYAAAAAYARQAGTTWPEHPRTRELFGLTSTAVGEEAVAQAWVQGERLSVRDLTALLADPG